MNGVTHIYQYDILKDFRRYLYQNFTTQIFVIVIGGCDRLREGGLVVGCCQRKELSKNGSHTCSITSDIGMLPPKAKSSLAAMLDPARRDKWAAARRCRPSDVVPGKSAKHFSPRTEFENRAADRCETFDVALVDESRWDSESATHSNTYPRNTVRKQEWGHSSGTVLEHM
jgi:hypothetical protein